MPSPSPPTSSSLGAGWRQPQPWPARTPFSSAAVLPPLCSQPAQPPTRYLSPTTKKPRCVSPVLGKDGLARLSQGGLHCCWEAAPGGCSTRFCPAGRGTRGLMQVAQQALAAAWLPGVPPLMYTEHSAAPCAKLYCVLVIFYLLGLKSCLAIILINAYSLAASCLLWPAPPPPAPREPCHHHVPWAGEVFNGCWHREVGGYMNECGTVPPGPTQPC